MAGELILENLLIQFLKTTVKYKTRVHPKVKLIVRINLKNGINHFIVNQ